MRLLLLLLLAATAISAATAPASSSLKPHPVDYPQATSVECMTAFKVLWILKTVHTWVYHSQSCNAPACQYSGPAQWDKVGYEASNRLVVGPGNLREETYTCSEPRMSSLTSMDCGRATVDYLVEAGWDGGWKSPYVLSSGLSGCAGITSASSCKPSRISNVCWDFTCNWKDCARFKLPTVCPPLLQGEVLAKHRQSYVPDARKCAREGYSDGQYCDCGCGEWDPDCWNQTRPIRGCPASRVCTYPGRECADRNFTLTDRKLVHYLADGVDVWRSDYRPDFGYYEPYSSHFLVDGKRGGALSLNNGHQHTLGFERRVGERLVPNEWTCPPEYYGSYDGCDSDMRVWIPGHAGCGPVRDPDCVGQGVPPGATALPLAAPYAWLDRLVRWIRRLF